MKFEDTFLHISTLSCRTRYTGNHIQFFETLLFLSFFDNLLSWFFPYLTGYSFSVSLLLFPPPYKGWNLP